MIPTIIGILTITFIIVQAVPGGPLEQLRDQLEGGGDSIEAAGSMGNGSDAKSRGISEEDYEKLKEAFGFHLPLWQRYLRMFAWYEPQDGDDRGFLKRFFDRENWKGMLLFRFGPSFHSNKTVLELIKQRLPVSVSLGLWSFLLTYPACILLGVAKAVKEGTRFDSVTTMLILLGYSIPGFVLAVALLVLFGPGEEAIIHLFPLSGLTSATEAGYESWPYWRKVLDYFHHIAAPVICLSIGSFAVLTILTKNSFLEEFSKQYVVTAHAKGLSERRVLYGHVFRNAMLPLVTGFPSRFVAIFLTGSVLIERIFNLRGIGLLAFNSVIGRDYTVVLGNLFIMTLIGLLVQLITDICYVLVDPRIDFERVES